MKKKLTAVALIVCMLAIMLVGATLAYFTDTDDAVNTFTTGNVEIDLTEVTYNGQLYLTFDFRDPNNGVAVNAYVVWVIGITFS